MTAAHEGRHNLADIKAGRGAKQRESSGSSIFILLETAQHGGGGERGDVVSI